MWLTSAVNGSDAVYRVSVNTGTGSGDLRLDLPASATIANLAGTPLAGLPYTSGESYTVIKTTGTAQRQGVPSNLGGGTLACVTVAAIGSSNTSVYTDITGVFSISGLSDGLYTFRVTYPGYLAVEKTDVSIPAPDLGKVTLRGGDVNGDNAVNILDIGTVISKFGKTGMAIGSMGACGAPDEPADINDDGIVNIGDLAITAGNWGKTGPIPWQP
jgi:hypothetical protein